MGYGMLGGLGQAMGKVADNMNTSALEQQRAAMTAEMEARVHERNRGEANTDYLRNRTDKLADDKTQHAREMEKDKPVREANDIKLNQIKADDENKKKVQALVAQHEQDIRRLEVDKSANPGYAQIANAAIQEKRRIIASLLGATPKNEVEKTTETETINGQELKGKTTIKQKGDASILQETSGDIIDYTQFKPKK